AVLSASLLAAPTAAPAAPGGPAAPAAPAERSPSAVPASAAKVPALKVRKLVKGLDLPWDVRALDKGKLIFTQRDRATLSTWKKGRTRKVKGFPSRKIWVSGETGLTGLAVDPAYAGNRRVYTCGGWRKSGGRHDIRVIAWTLDAQARRVTGRKVLVKGFPTTSGRHGGCRLLIARDGSLLVGTGDAAVGTNPRDLDSLGGKTLRIDRFSGAPWPSNPYAAATTPRRYVHTYGHRNVQGLAERADGSLWSVEHGPTRDDEVNLLVNGGDYGWNPVPGYNESVPMTDQGLPGTQVEARWSSGAPTVATSGADFVSGAQWGALDEALAVACLKAGRVIFMTFDAAGNLKRTRVPAALRAYGRLRGVTSAPDGALLVTTSNGGGNDSILRVTPR
ncbi:PQQ-dependent sugar dehydrogenase, partial [Nocardioides sp.]|uniref:PQQ-dependent sugar dehydrogenase n=1 Tax=Nocardioides sp. TaxID=35761 RepID=UPI001A22F955